MESYRLLFGLDQLLGVKLLEGNQARGSENHHQYQEQRDDNPFENFQGSQCLTQ